MVDNRLGASSVPAIIDGFQNLRCGPSGDRGVITENRVKIHSLLT